MRNKNRPSCNLLLCLEQGHFPPDGEDCQMTFARLKEKIFILFRIDINYFITFAVTNKNKIR